MITNMTAARKILARLDSINLEDAELSPNILASAYGDLEGIFKPYSNGTSQPYLFYLKDLKNLSKNYLKPILSNPNTPTEVLLSALRDALSAYLRWFSDISQNEFILEDMQQHKHFKSYIHTFKFDWINWVLENDVFPLLILENPNLIDGDKILKRIISDNRKQIDYNKLTDFNFKSQLINPIFIDWIKSLA